MLPEEDNLLQRPLRGPRGYEKIREEPLERRGEIIERIDNMHASTNDAFTEPGDLGDWANASAEIDLGIRIRESETGELRAIDAALKRIEESTYGICEDCGKPIPRARLMAIPNATRCLECKMEWERGRAPSWGTPRRRPAPSRSDPPAKADELVEEEGEE